MTPTLPIKRTAVAGALASLMVAGAAPAGAVNIPEGGAVTPDSVFLFHLRVTEGCDGSPVDGLEVTIPESVLNPTPEAVAGWITSIEAPVTEDDPEEATGEEATPEATVEVDGDAGTESELTVIRWDGGPLEDGLLQDFGIRARFPDEPDAVIEFPVVKRCGEVEQQFTPTVRLTTRYGQGEIAALADSVVQLQAEVDELRVDLDDIQEQIGQVNVTGLRNRVEDLEASFGELDERVTQVEEAEAAAESAPAE